MKFCNPRLEVPNLELTRGDKRWRVVSGGNRVVVVAATDEQVKKGKKERHNMSGGVSGG